MGPGGGTRGRRNGKTKIKAATNEYSSRKEEEKEAEKKRRRRRKRTRVPNGIKAGKPPPFG